MTASEKFNQAWEQQASEVLQKRAFQNLSLAVAAVARIDCHSKQLIALLGDGDERSNIDALTRWIKREYQKMKREDELPTSESLVDALYTRLTKQLDQFLWI
jgi:hypothetical protein